MPARWRRGLFGEGERRLVAIVVATTLASASGGAILSTIIIDRATDVAGKAVDAQLSLIRGVAVAAGDARAVQIKSILSEVETKTHESGNPSDVLYRLEIAPAPGRPAEETMGSELLMNGPCISLDGAPGSSSVKPLHWRPKGGEPYLVSCLNFPGRPNLTVYAGQKIDTRSGVVWVAAIALGVLQLATLMVLFRSIRRRLQQRVHDITKTADDFSAGNFTEHEEVTSHADEFSEFEGRLAAAGRSTTEYIEQLKSISNAIAHDYGGRLSRVRMSVQGAYRSAEMSGARSKLKDADKGIVALEEQFIRFLSVMQRHAASKDDAPRRAVHVRDIIDTVLDELTPRINHRGIVIRCEIPNSASIEAIGDGVLLRHTFDNLIRNALKYTDEGGTLTITWQDTEGGGFHLKFRNPTSASVPPPSGRLGEAGVRGADTADIPGHGYGLSHVVKFCRIDGLELTFPQRPGEFEAAITRAAI